MELTMQFLFVVAQTTTTAAVLHLLSRLASLNGLLYPFGILASFGSALCVVTVYYFVVYPLIDPLRKFPVVDISDLRIMLPITDAPRGDKALEWTKQFPDEDAIRVRVRYSMTILVPLSTAALRDLFGTHQQDFEKPVGGVNFLSQQLGYGLLLSEGATHARQRKHLTSSFRIQNIRALHNLMLLKTDILIRNMEIENERRIGKGIDLNIWASKVTLDIIGSALMSQDFDSLNVEKQPVNEAFGRLTAGSAGTIQLFMWSLILPKWLVSILPTATNKTIWSDVRLLRDTCERSLAEIYTQVKSGGKYDSSDILSSIIADPGASQEEVIDEMVTFLAAGHDTTSASIAWTAHLLTLPENQKYQDLLREEILAHPGCTDSPTALESLPWLNAIMEETLRVYPPATTTTRKAIRDSTIAGCRVPRGTVITVFPWAINRNPRYWGGSHAEKFIPERWLDKRPDGSLHVNGHGGAESNYCNMTFLQGNRSCIGKGFSKAELRLIIAKLFSNFYVSRLPGDDGAVRPAGTITIKPGDGLFINLERVG